MIQMNGEKPQLIAYVQGPQTNTRPTGSETAEADMPSCAKERGLRPGTSKWRERVRKEAKRKCLVNKCLPCLTEKSF